jgi:hypothetical protein
VVYRRDLENEPFTHDECPAVNITVGEYQPDELVSYDEHHMPVTLELFLSSRSGAGDSVDALLVLLAAAIVANGTWGGYADGTGSAAINTDNQYELGDVISKATLSFTVHFTTDKGGL